MKELCSWKDALISELLTHVRSFDRHLKKPTRMLGVISTSEVSRGVKTSDKLKKDYSDLISWILSVPNSWET